jgi:hypothetical protein
MVFYGIGGLSEYKPNSKSVQSLLSFRMLFSITKELSSWINFHSLVFTDRKYQVIPFVLFLSASKYESRMIT